MNLFQVFLFVALSFVESNGFPQSASEIAIGTKHTEQLYYNMDVRQCRITKAFKLDDLAIAGTRFDPV